MKICELYTQILQCYVTGTEAHDDIIDNECISLALWGFINSEELSYIKFIQMCAPRFEVWEFGMSTW